MVMILAAVLLLPCVAAADTRQHALCLSPHSRMAGIDLQAGKFVAVRVNPPSEARGVWLCHGPTERAAAILFDSASIMQGVDERHGKLLSRPGGPGTLFGITLAPPQPPERP